MFNSILIAIDTKKKADEVLSNISSLKPLQVSKINLLHVLDERVNEKDFSIEEKEVFENAQKTLKNNGFQVEAVVTRGIPFDSIVHESMKINASLIVMGTGNNPKWKNVLFGENVQRVLELSSLPVMVCRNYLVGHSLLDHVLLGVDFSNGSHYAFKKIKQLAEENPGAVGKVTLLHVHEQRNIDLLMRFVAREQIDKDIATEKDRLNEMAQALLNAGVRTVDVQMHTGNPVEEIITAIGMNNPTLTVLGAQGQGGSLLYRIGTTALRVAQLASSSVCVVPSGPITLFK